MRNTGWAIAICALALVASCGGGGDAAIGDSGASANTASAAPQPSPIMLAAGEPQRSVQPLTTATALFEWAQQNFPQFFTGTGADGVAGPFSYRFYAQTSTYLALSADGGVYVKGPVSDNQIVFIAPLTLLRCFVSPSVCPAISVGGAVAGAITSPGDQDWHTVSLTAGQAYSFDVEGAPNQGTLVDPLLRLFDSAGKQLTVDDDSGVSISAKLVCAPSTSGVYYLAAAESAGTDTGTYRLSVTPIAGPAVPCESRPVDTGTNWQSPFSGPEILAGTVTLGPLQRVGATFDISGGDTALEAIFVSQGSADLFLMSSADLPACLAGGSFNFFTQFSFQGQSGVRLLTLAPGSYASSARNQTSAPNPARLELQRQTAVAGFHFSLQQFAPVAQTIAAGGRLAQPVTAGDRFRTFVEGANTGGVFFIIPASETQNFLSGQPFQHQAELTAACAPADASAPELCELPGIGPFAVAYFNNTASAQSIVIEERDYVPD
jgi:hypothetical protein